MLICGLKLTHDGSVALVDDSRLLCSIEVEKIGNNPRYSALDSLELVEEILSREGVALDDVDRFVVDGWQAPQTAAAAVLQVTAGGERLEVQAASYNELGADGGPSDRLAFDGLVLGGSSRGYSSFRHATDHLYAAYCTSPFAERGEDSLVLVWDAGMLPHLYNVHGATLRVDALGPVFPLAGSAFAYLAVQFPPFLLPSTAVGEARLRSHLEVAGKAMAYAALGRVEPEAFKAIDELWDTITEVSLETPLLLAEKIRDSRATMFAGMSEADIIATYQAYLGDLLVSSLRRRASGMDDPPNICLTGGCALNIKWNAALRASGTFREIWIHPFPNDAGSALGAACAEMVHSVGRAALEWDVYRGPALEPSPVPAGWAADPCDEAGVARLLHEEGKPIIFLGGDAELGPRALGNRSILAPPTDPAMKAHLNDIKEREPYRPVAPVCLEEDAPRIFSPGTPDPYMLFEHELHPGWAERIPAVIHLDGTARLQTVNDTQHPVLARVLRAYKDLSGIPVLCNTSANLKGRGFFPDVTSAAAWGGTERIWAEGTLYSRKPS